MTPDPARQVQRLAGRDEGLLLDPVYTGRAMDGPIGLIRKGKFAPDETVLFGHAGIVWVGKGTLQ